MHIQEIPLNHVRTQKITKYVYVILYNIFKSFRMQAYLAAVKFSEAFDIVLHFMIGIFRRFSNFYIF